MAPLISLHEVTYRYGDGTTALNRLSLSIERGERLALIGANGSGKSTLFLCLIGILKPAEGSICFEGKPVQRHKAGLLELRKKVGMIFQDPDAQLFCLDVYQEVAFGPSNLGWGRDMVKAKAEEAMRRTDVYHLRDKAPHFLSYGQKKRVAAASVLVMEPEALLFDEPTAGLDPQHAKEMMDFIGGLDAAVCLSTHDMDLAFGWADRVAVLKDGNLLAQGDPPSVFKDAETLEKAALYQPMTLRLYRFMQEQNLLPHTACPPRSVDALLKLFPSPPAGGSRRLF
ncbi:MAG: energy-coupling factor ABC transporter ATP-binding protein [Spirochaetaceae bacterium]|jgi:cobalt/nickel transport system ATP-binding protein|nr:energy-coupling factor ABC transporter ATP-binding protein [Spirochaetaceae bacterium]